jgi:NADH-quinone oxidoreductase subunit L
MFRLLWLAFLGKSRVDAKVDHHVHESPLSMTGVLMLLALLSAVGGFIAIPHFLEPQMALPATHEALHHFETPLLVVSVLIAAVGVAAAAFVFGGPASRAEGLQRAFAPLHRLLSGKYFIDELYESVIGRPLVWISDRVFLRLGDRALLDGTLNGLGAIGRGTGWALGKLQTGNLHLYAAFVVLGAVGALLWSWHRV